MKCFVPLMEKFHKTYGRYPKYKETSDKNYHENPYRAVNFQRDESGNLRMRIL